MPQRLVATDIHSVRYSAVDERGHSGAEVRSSARKPQLQGEICGNDCRRGKCFQPRPALTVTAATTTTIAQSGSTGNYTLKATVIGGRSGNCSKLGRSRSWNQHGDAVPGNGGVAARHGGWSDLDELSDAGDGARAAVHRGPGTSNGDGNRGHPIGTDGTTTTSGTG